MGEEDESAGFCTAYWIKKSNKKVIRTQIVTVAALNGGSKQ